MKRFSIWLREHKLWTEDSMGRFRQPIATSQTLSPRHTLHIHQPTAPDQTGEYKPTPPVQTTQHYNPHADTDHDLHDHPVLNRLLNIVKHDIDALTWDFGKDSVETAIAGVEESLPNYKQQCDRIKGCWQAFKDRLYKELREGVFPWWGGSKKEAPNPVIYDVALMRLRELEKLFDQMKQLCQECEKDEVNQLFLTFLKEYSSVMPGLKQQIEKLQKTVPRR